jgi:DNA repair protein SbcC/Rad50
MIPLKLTLKNFLSYRDSSLNFSGLHTACICGANGAGKSSLLEAITWAIWGETRAKTEDDIIYHGATDTRVDFIFQINDQIYRVIRTKQRGQTGTLDLQISTTTNIDHIDDHKFKSITSRRKKETQDLIKHHLRLDYDTFINSSYLRQGRADEFMLKNPAQRKEVLADLLKLSQYEELAEKAKEKTKEYKSQVEGLTANLENIKDQLSLKDHLTQERDLINQQIAELQQLQSQDEKQLNSLQTIQHQRQTWENQLLFIQQQYQNQQQDCLRLQQDIAQVEVQFQRLQIILNQSAEIMAGHDEYLRLQAEEERWDILLAEFNELQQSKNQLLLEKNTALQTLTKQLQKAETDLESLKEQHSECTKLINRYSNLESDLLALATAKNRLKYYDDIQVQVSPLMQRQNQIYAEIEKAKARLLGQLENNKYALAELVKKLANYPQIKQNLFSINEQIKELDKKRVYKERIEDKGKDQTEKKLQLESQQKAYNEKQQELEEKIANLTSANAVCPLCDRPMDENHNHQVLQQTKKQKQDVVNKLWDLEDDLIHCQREIDKLRQEYKDLTQQLSGYNQLLDSKAHLTAQLEDLTEKQTLLQQLKQEINQLETSLQTGDYLQQFQQELTEIDSQLKTLDYNEKDHSLTRTQVDNLRWVEIKQAEIKQAVIRQEKLLLQIPTIEQKIIDFQTEIKQTETEGEIAIAIVAIEEKIKEINYNSEQHQQIKTAWRKAQNWSNSYQQLQQAQIEYPILEQKNQDLSQSLQERLKTQTELEKQMQIIRQDMAEISDFSQEIKQLEQQIFQRRQQLDNSLGKLGSLQQKIADLEMLSEQFTLQQEELKKSQLQQKVHQNLADAFGKNGIQTLMIENILPQMEAETNRILSRLSGNQFHVQFVTQKAGKKQTKRTTKLIDTLDILIADARGTRPYETYSGGEAFRINFAIRLALAKILAQRAGTALQMLIVDEGFGTQDQEGCDRLVAAINAISNDFHCILTVTHIPAFKEAFQSRIEIIKTQNGSQIRLS